MNNDQNVLSLNEWIDKYQNTIIRFLEYKKVWTPYELDRKFQDETEWKDIHYTFGYLREAVLLPDGDVLLKIQELNELDDDADKVYFWRKLSDIQITQFDYDN